MHGKGNVNEPLGWGGLMETFNRQFSNCVGVENVITYTDSCYNNGLSLLVCGFWCEFLLFLCLYTGDLVLAQFFRRCRGGSEWNSLQRH